MTNDKFKRGYANSKSDSKRRGIEFLFTFEQWRDWWIATGKWEQRGRKAGCFQMCRIYDVGPYSPENVYCDTIEENSKLPHKGTKRPAEWSEKLSGALRGKKKSYEHVQSLAASRLGKKYKTPAGIFQTSSECEAATGIKRATVMWRCKNNFQGQWSYA